MKTRFIIADFGISKMANPLTQVIGWCQNEKELDTELKLLAQKRHFQGEPVLVLAPEHEDIFVLHDSQDMIKSEIHVIRFFYDITMPDKEDDKPKTDSIQ